MENIFIPQEDVNSEGATIIELRKKNYDRVEKDEIIATVETSKAVFDIVSPNKGFIVYLVTEKGFLPYDRPVALIALDEKEIDNYKKKKDKPKQEDKLTARFTKKALQLAQQNDIDIKTIKSKKIVTEKDIMRLIEKSSSYETDVSSIIITPGVLPSGLNRIIVLGGGFGAMQVIDILLNNSQNQIVGILDDNPDLSNLKIFGIPFRGTIKKLKKQWVTNSFDQAIISISTNNLFRKILYDECKSLGIPMANAICPSVRINRNSVIGEGNIICSQVHIGTCSSIGNNNFISAQTNIEHHNVWGSNITTGPNCSTSSRVQIRDNVKMGTGIFIQPGITIGKNCLIASGSVITKSIPDNHALKTKLSYEIKALDKK